MAISYSKRARALIKMFEGTGNISRLTKELKELKKVEEDLKLASENITKILKAKKKSVMKKVQVKKMIISTPAKMSVKDFGTDPLWDKWARIIYRKYNRIGKLLRTEKIKVIKVPNGMRIKSIENNKPSVRMVTINLIKKL